MIPFLESPTLEKIEYKKAQGYRDAMESGIRNAQLDLDTQTIKKGTPHTLLVIKNEATYKKLFLPVDTLHHDSNFAVCRLTCTR